MDDISFRLANAHVLRFFPELKGGAWGLPLAGSIEEGFYPDVILWPLIPLRSVIDFAPAANDGGAPNAA